MGLPTKSGEKTKKKGSGPRAFSPGPLQCLAVSRLRSRVRIHQVHDADLVGGALLGLAVHDLGVDPALDPALQGQGGAGIQAARQHRHLAPGDAGQIVRPAIPPVHRQHHVADAPPQGRPPQHRRFAQHPLKLDLVAVVVLLRLRQDPGEYGDDQPAALARLVVEGAELPLHRQPPPLQRQQGLELFAGGDDVDHVRLAGQPPDGQGKPEKPLAVVFVGDLGIAGRAPQPDKVARIIHMYAHLIGSPAAFRLRLTVEHMRGGGGICPAAG